jgi:hypothetical protein
MNNYFHKNKLLFLLTFFITFSFSTFVFAQENKIVKNIHFDNKLGVISYELTKPCWIRIRIGTKEGPLHYTLDWEREESGRHIKEYDGLDESGSFNLLDNPRCTMALNYFTDEPLDDLFDTAQTANYDNSSFIGRVPKSMVLADLYRKHHREFAYDPEVELVFPLDTSRTEEGLPIVKDITPIVFKLRNKDKAWFRQERFQVQIFIDDVYMAGESEGYTPFTYNFNPQGINEGKHQLIVNLRGLYDHIGVGEAAVVVENAD